MTHYSDIELEIINISLGVTIKLKRLENNLSQLDLGNMSNTDNTIVGRIERSEHISSWLNIYKVSQELNIEFSSLFILKKEIEILKMIDNCLVIEKRLTKEKQSFYNSLKIRIQNLFIELKSANEKPKNIEL
ncbi:XRE family transcriptional regulator [Sphingobacterium sp. JUb56]|uniref:XRE family transcriptional regulator n=1 Tax=Sphingobacterium sp. JUb56 TaxID=2587145 RepID=UPI001620F780|nr:XRE family transcriptional regulator [Sphingobacterium sp. JUb56]MBB2950639.1 transcriptional regulator with XRE-family HTH domain [Sphingobacterium sp. JUb56]